MNAFYGSKISEHLARLRDGSLLCRSVPIARTGRQQYRAEEIFTDTSMYPPARGGGLIDVERPAEEVFAKTTMASFEGSPLCDDHPAGFVTPLTWKTFAAGHLQNVREGPRLPDGNRTLCADLIVRDKALAEAIELGVKREVSCGYDCTYEGPRGDGSYVQRGIIGNHVAVVRKGRAGDGCRVYDSAVHVYTIDDVLSKFGRVLALAWQQFPHLQPAIAEFFDDPMFGVQTMDRAVDDAAQYAAQMRALHRRQL